MKIHYYGKLDSMESCYTFQTFDINDVKVHIQNSTRFGYEPATLSIKNPAMFIEKNGEFFRFVVEDFITNIKDGKIMIENDTVQRILNEAVLLIS